MNIHVWFLTFRKGLLWDIHPGYDFIEIIVYTCTEFKLKLSSYCLEWLSHIIVGYKLPQAVYEIFLYVHFPSNFCTVEVSSIFHHRKYKLCLSQWPSFESFSGEVLVHIVSPLFVVILTCIFYCGLATVPCIFQILDLC